MGKNLNILGAPFWQVQARGQRDQHWCNVCSESYEIGNHEDQQRALRKATHAMQTWQRQETFANHQWRVVPGQN